MSRRGFRWRPWECGGVWLGGRLVSVLRQRAMQRLYITVKKSYAGDGRLFDRERVVYMLVTPIKMNTRY